MTDLLAAVLAPSRPTDSASVSNTFVAAYLLVIHGAQLLKGQQNWWRSLALVYWLLNHHTPCLHCSTLCYKYKIYSLVPIMFCFSHWCKLRMYSVCCVQLLWNPFVHNQPYWIGKYCTCWEQCCSHACLVCLALRGCGSKDTGHYCALWCKFSLVEHFTTVDKHSIAGHFNPKVLVNCLLLNFSSSILTHLWASTESCMPVMFMVRMRANVMCTFATTDTQALINMHEHEHLHMQMKTSSHIPTFLLGGAYEISHTTQNLDISIKKYIAIIQNGMACSLWV